MLHIANIGRSLTKANPKFIKAGVGCLLLIFAAQAVRSMREKSVTVDEIMYITAGYYHLKTGDFHMNMTNPPITKVISALPLLALDLRLPALEKDPKEMDIIEQWKYSRSFFYDNDADADHILFLARVPIVLLAVILGLYVFLWSKQLYGSGAGLFALLLYSFSPNILAYSRLATQDLGVAAFMFISTYYFWKYMTCPGAKSLTTCGVVTGMAILTKLTALLLFPIYAAYSVICIARKNDYGKYLKLPFVTRFNISHPRLSQSISLVSSILVIGFLSIITVNVGYGFQDTFQPLGKDRFPMKIQERVDMHNHVTEGVYDGVREIPMAIPGPYVESVKFQFLNRLSRKGSLSLRGVLSNISNWMTAVTIKTPIAVLLLMVVSISFLMTKGAMSEGEWLIVSFMAIVVVVFWCLDDSIWVRYILPIFPAMHVMMSRILAINFKWRKVVMCTVAGLSLWYVYGTVSIYPHYLAFFNETVGGPENGYKYLVSSNLDWGQDLGGLREYLSEKGIERIKLGYFGSADASYYGIDYEYLPSVGLAPKAPGQYWWYEIDSGEKRDCRPQKGTIAISATLLTSPGWMRRKFNGWYEWLKQYEPVDNVGYSILIYNIK